MFKLKSSNASARREQVLSESLEGIKNLDAMGRVFLQQKDADPKKARQAMQAFEKHAAGLADEFDEYVKTHCCSYCKTPN